MFALAARCFPAPAVLLISLVTWLIFEPLRANAAPSRVAFHAAFVALACLAVHGLAVLTSTIFDDMVQMWVVMGVALDEANRGER